MPFDGLGHGLGGVGLGLGGDFDGFRLVSGRFEPTLGLKDHRLALALGHFDRRLLVAFRRQNLGALFLVGLLLLAHGGQKIRRRTDIPDLYPGHLDAPSAARDVQFLEDFFVHLDAFRQYEVEFAQADDGTDVGQGQLLAGADVVGHVISGLVSVHNDQKDDGIHRDRGVVLGDDLLAGDLDGVLHHVHAAAHPVNEGDDELEAWLERGDILAEALHHDLIALFNGHDALRHDHQGENDDDEQKEEGQTHGCVPKGEGRWGNRTAKTRRSEDAQNYYHRRGTTMARGAGSYFWTILSS